MGDPKLLEAVYLDPRLSFSLRKLREVINWGNAEDVLAP
jgi:hypothetical protein